MSEMSLLEQSAVCNVQSATVNLKLYNERAVDCQLSTANCQLNKYE